ncbi:sensor histidine kinase [Thermopolyspora sp. NPDC052614]|uniref:sensor histidine kinase n=1 Tax=Thermopolyspora sp. NPDC052614 TaxID=3155682 RepID=UPI0034249143
MTLVARPRRWSLARQMLALQIAVVGVIVLGASVLAIAQARALLTEEAAAVARGVTISVAESPVVPEALGEANPSAVLQPYAERIRTRTGVDFITIMSPDGRRYTHPNPSRIGGRFLGNTGPALAGRTFTETYTGTLGPSVRAVAPVRDKDGRIVALVSAGITVQKISEWLRGQLAWTGLIGLVGLGVGVAGAALVGARLRRQTHGLGPTELSRMYEYHEAILHAVREGLLLVDAGRRLTLCNDGARELLGLAADAEGRPVTELDLPPSLAELLAAGTTRTDEIHVTGDRVLLVSVSVVRAGSRSLGTVVTLRDHTELQALTSRLDAERGFADSLRSVAHESANRLHTVVSLVELGRTEQAVAFATQELKMAQRLTDKVVGAVREPVLAALLLGKSAVAAERGVELVIEGEIDDTGVEERELVTIVGNLIDNAIDAAGSGPPPQRVEVHLRADDAELVIRVADSGPGLDPTAAREAFRKGWTTKGDGRGLGLALVGQAVRRLGGSVEVGHETGPVVSAITGPGSATPPDPDSGPTPGTGLDATPGRRSGRSLGAVFTVRLPLRQGERNDPE